MPTALPPHTIPRQVSPSLKSSPSPRSPESRSSRGTKAQGVLAPRRASFSLVELLASAVILSVLAVMGVPYAETVKDRQREIELRDALFKMRSALQSYMVNEASVDIDGDGAPGEDPMGNPSGDGIFDDDRDGRVDEDGPPIFPPSLNDLVAKGYLAAIPRDPLSEDATSSPTDPAKIWNAVVAKRTLITDTTGRWVLDAGGVTDTPCPSVPGAAPVKPACTITGIVDVHTFNQGPSLSGSAYSTW